MILVLAKVFLPYIHNASWLSKYKISIPFFSLTIYILIFSINIKILYRLLHGFDGIGLVSDPLSRTALDQDNWTWPWTRLDSLEWIRFILCFRRRPSSSLESWSVIWGYEESSRERTIEGSFYRLAGPVNPPPPGGGSDPTPPRFFSGITSSFITVSTWNLAHLSGHQFGVVSCKENQNRPEFFCHRSNFVTSFHAILGRLKVNVWKFTKNRVFEPNANTKWIKHRKARSIKWLSRIF